MGIHIMAKPGETPDYINTDYGSPAGMKVIHEGMVVNTFEINEYHDSDFIAEYWDEEAQEFRAMVYATTRGWTYPCKAIVDASPELKEKFRQFKWEQSVRISREVLARQWFRFGQDAKNLLTLVDDTEDLFGYWEESEMNQRIVHALGHAVRSKFRLSLRDQFVEFFNTPIEDRGYSQPLSPNQIGALLRQF